MKFLVLGHLDVGRPGPDVIKAITETPAYANKMESVGKEELDPLLAMSPVYNYTHDDVMALADMSDPATAAGKARNWRET